MYIKKDLYYEGHTHTDTYIQTHKKYTNTQLHRYKQVHTQHQKYTHLENVNHVRLDRYVKMFKLENERY